MGFNRVYTAHFLVTLKAKARARLRHHPELCDPRRLAAAGTIRAYDDIITAPLHGFRDAEDYWRRSSSKPYLKTIQVPTLVLNARNDPFMPGRVLPSAHEASKAVTLEFPEQGGHVGFVAGGFPGRLDWLPRRILGFLDSGHDV
jgi:predicted alpha/beta-fold hydrolase